MMLRSLSSAVLATAALVLLAGCETRSISNSGYDHAYRYGRSAEQYSGELSELDVLGVAPDATVSDSDIAAALNDHQRPHLERNSRVLLIQSGAEFPDEAMVSALEKHFSVLPFSGRPIAHPSSGNSYAKNLRLTAARGGYDKIICYWGVLGSEQKNQVTKVVSWIPLAGYFVPDQRENMRIRLKAAIVDVASGRWTFVTPPPAATTDLSSIVSRRDTDQTLVTALKQTGYQNLVRTLVDEHTS